MNGLAVYGCLEEAPGDLLSRHTALVQRVAHHLMVRLPASVQIDDLIQAGMLGLLEASRRFNPNRGANFATFAERRIRGAMLDEIRKGDWAPRSVHRKAREVAAAIQAVETAKGGEARDQEVAEELGLSLAEYHDTLSDLRGQKLLSLQNLGGNEEDEDSTDLLAASDIGPEETVHRELVLQQLVRAIDGLPEREKLVLSLYYDEGLNLKEIGAVLEVSESRVSQLHSQALARLRARVNG
jgi:RNA polymerase sigma factor for flagellar operon FliA